MRSRRVSWPGAAALLAVAAALASAGSSGAATPPQCSLSGPAYTGGNGPRETTPVAQFGYAPVGPIAGGTTTFDASRSTDADGDTIVSYLWSFGDGTTTAATASPVISHSFATTGNFKVTLTVVDCRDARGSATVTIPVGKTSVAICRSHRTVAVALPHTQGAVVLSVTIATVGKSTRRIRGASLRRSALHLSFFGYPKRPVTVTVRYRQQGHTKSRKHTYHPCTSGH